MPRFRLPFLSRLTSYTTYNNSTAVGSSTCLIVVVVVLPFVRLRSYAVGVVIVFVGLDSCRLPRAPPGDAGAGPNVVC